MAAPSSSLPNVNLSDLQVARNYADHVWSETFCRRKMEAYPALASQVHHQLTPMLQADFLSAEQRREAGRWMVSHFNHTVALQQEMNDLINRGSALAQEYQNRRIAIGREIIERPQYYIDVTRPAALLEIQRKYDVLREAVHLATRGYSHQMIQWFRRFPGRCFYSGSHDLTPEMSELAEIQELQAQDIANISTDHWLPELIAMLTNRTREGRSLEFLITNMDWGMLQLHDGVTTPSDFLEVDQYGRTVGRIIIEIEGRYLQRCKAEILQQLPPQHEWKQVPGHEVVHQYIAESKSAQPHVEPHNSEDDIARDPHIPPNQDRQELSELPEAPAKASGTKTGAGRVRLIINRAKKVLSRGPGSTPENNKGHSKGEKRPLSKSPENAREKKKEKK